MQGIVVDNAGGDFHLVDTLEEPTPGRNQILVKSLVTAINPVEGFMQGTGQLVTAWPIVLGCDASGTVVEVGEGVTKFKIGDAVFGCTTLGTPGHSTFQEYFLMDEDLTFKKPGGVTTEQAATIGVGLLTAALGVIIGANVELKAKESNSQSPWLIVLGAAGGVGQFAVQLGKLCGYRVLGSSSPSNTEVVKAAGAEAVFDYKLPLDEQLATIQQVTNGNFTRVFDASAMGTETGIDAVTQVADQRAPERYFSTTNDWAPIDPREGVAIHHVELGQIGRSGSEKAEKINKDIVTMIPNLEDYLGAGLLRPLEYVQVGDIGVGEVLKALEAFKNHKSGKKLVVRLAEN
ncbi:hypothetical protein VE01_03434 [Pseudogymnoascus verrucosus]|uniref:Enoyl reductase (ER) domain-containing protein n=1 Tax=Pseudogymnoascus verrucosus TaxID=342668 RepID=A0A1B8GSM1_9PEZI|nr:uncharacterized protein VE01_03434 [Pseudogymnoascus verrucosus]OBT98834.1 hypothetical protein VE01_03434 [Pseudogymnoascus verrucosus]